MKKQFCPYCKKETEHDGSGVCTVAPLYKERTDGQKEQSESGEAKQKKKE